MTEQESMKLDEHMINLVTAYGLPAVLRAVSGQLPVDGFDVTAETLEEAACVLENPDDEDEEEED